MKIYVVYSLDDDFVVMIEENGFLEQSDFCSWYLLYVVIFFQEIFVVFEVEYWFVI